MVTSLVVETRGDLFEPVDLEATVAAVRRDLELQIAESDAEITVDSLPRVRGDPSQLRQVFQNLLSNAIEYSGDEPPRIRLEAERCEALRVSERSSAERSSANSRVARDSESPSDHASGPEAREQTAKPSRDDGSRSATSEPPRDNGEAAEDEGDTWRVSVSDDGIGIDPEDADRVFEIFQRLHSREDHDGTGIGLALCQRIVERHGGEIRVDSEPGEGSTFSVTLPAADD